MKKLSLILSLVCIAALSPAQTSDTDYSQLYERLVSRVGYGGVGVETLLDKWEQADSANTDVYLARARYHFARSRTDSVKVHEGRKYLDMDPVLVLKDSLNKPIYYYNEPFFDETRYGMGLKVLDNVIASHPLDLNLCIFKNVTRCSVILYKQIFVLNRRDVIIEFLISCKKNTPCGFIIKPV